MVGDHEPAAPMPSGNAGKAPPGSQVVLVLHADNGASCSRHASQRSRRGLKIVSLRRRLVLTPCQGPAFRCRFRSIGAHTANDGPRDGQMSRMPESPASTGVCASGTAITNRWSITCEQPSLANNQSARQKKPACIRVQTRGRLWIGMGPSTGLRVANPVDDVASLGDQLASTGRYSPAVSVARLTA